MSGTSADGIDVAIVRLRGHGLATRMKLLGHTHVDYPPAVREAVLTAMNASMANVADLSRLNFTLGELYAEAVIAARKAAGTKLELIGCHGQTIYHQGQAAPYLGGYTACTWQTGEGAIVAARTGTPVVSDFRPADMAAGGRGAPLVPMLDYILFHHRKRGRIVQNIGGIANLTVIPSDAQPQQVVAFDTGPGNMVIDACMEHLFRRAFDRDGKVAASGKTLPKVLAEALRDPYFRLRPPKTAGREEFGRGFVRDFLRRCGRARKEDVIATATALTAVSIAESVSRFALSRFGPGPVEMVASGGGTKNRTLMRMLREQLAALDVRLKTVDELGLPTDAKEAAAFAVLAYQTWHCQPSNMPSATGAKRPAILGKISYA